jgi:hypothetical protein
MSTPTDSVDLEAIACVGVGGYVIRTTTDPARILRFVTVSGRIVTLALGDGLAAHVAAKATELELAAMEAGEVLRDLGLYEAG